MKRFFTLTLALSLTLTLAACGGKADPAPTPGSSAPTTESTAPSETPAVLSGVEDGVLTVAMECAYAPYNWTQSDDSNGAVPIVNNPGSYANGYDVTIAKKIAEANNWDLEIMAIEWDGLSPALSSGTVDMGIAGPAMTATRRAEVALAGP